MNNVTVPKWRSNASSVGTCTFRTKRALANIDRIMTALATPKTRPELEDIVCLSHQQVLFYITYLKDVVGCIGIVPAKGRAPVYQALFPPG